MPRGEMASRTMRGSVHMPSIARLSVQITEPLAVLHRAVTAVE